MGGGDADRRPAGMGQARSARGAYALVCVCARALEGQVEGEGADALWRCAVCRSGRPATRRRRRPRARRRGGTGPTRGYAMPAPQHSRALFSALTLVSGWCCCVPQEGGGGGWDVDPGSGGGERGGKRRREDRDHDYRDERRHRDDYRRDGHRRDGWDREDDRGGRRQRRAEELDRVGSMLASNREDKAAAPRKPTLEVVSKFPVDPHGKGHDKEYKLPMTPFAAPAEVAAVRRDRESGEITYHPQVSAFPVVVPDPKKVVDLTINRKGSDLCGSDPVGLEHIEAALKEGGKKDAREGLDFICDSGSLQQLFATPYETDKDWEVKVHVRDAPTCVLFEGCASPLATTGYPEGVSPEDWVQWGRNLKRLCLDGSPQAHFTAVLRTKLGGLRCALATSWECVDRKGPLLFPLAPVPASSQQEGDLEPELEERTRLYREKVLLHAWIECFLSGIQTALVGQCDCKVVPATTDEDGNETVRWHPRACGLATCALCAAPRPLISCGHLSVRRHPVSAQLRCTRSARRLLEKCIVQHESTNCGTGTTLCTSGRPH